MSKYLLRRSKLEKWTITVLFKSLSHASLKPEVWYSLRYDRGYKQQNRGATKSTKMQLGSIVWGHTATFRCSLIPRKDGGYEKKLLTLELQEHAAAGRMGQRVGKDVNIDIAKYVNPDTDREYSFPVPVSATQVGTLHVMVRARQGDVGAPAGGYDMEDGTDTHPRSDNSTVSALSDASENSAGEERANHHEVPRRSQPSLVAEINGSMNGLVRQVTHTPSEASVPSSHGRHSAHSDGTRAAYIDELRRRKAIARARLPIDSPGSSSTYTPASLLGRAQSAPSLPPRINLDSTLAPRQLLPRAESLQVEALRARVKELEAELKRRDSRASARTEVAKGRRESRSHASNCSSRPQEGRGECGGCVIV